MKIIYITHRFYPSIGGIENHVYEIARRMAKRHDVYVYSADGEYNGQKEVIGKIKIRRFKSWHPGNAYFLSFPMYKALKNESCDVLHLHNYNAFPALLAFKAISAKKIIFTPHYHIRSPSWLRQQLHRLYDPFQSQIFGKARVICVSQFEKRMLKKKSKKANVVAVIPNGYQNNDVIAKKEKKKLLYIGRLEKYKNVQEAILSLKGNPGWSLDIIGKGSYEPELRAFAKGLPVRFLGKLSWRKVKEHYRKASLTINLSSLEAFGMTIIESLAAETPVVVSKAGAFQELKRENPQWIHDYSTAQGYFDTLIRKRKTPDLKRYRWDAIAKETKKVYGF